MSTEDQPSIEDRVRSATRARANLVHDIRPLGAPEPVRLRRAPAPAPRSRRWINWGIPLVAAAAVVAIALTLVAVRQSGTPAKPVSPPTPAQTVPRYYAALDIDAHGDPYTGPLIVGDDVTGKVIATVPPPSGLMFDTVKRAADDRTFVISTSRKADQGTGPVSWYLLRTFPGTPHPYQLTKLAIKSQGLVYSVSPNGQELAVGSLDNGANATAPTTIALYSVSSGAELRAWTAPHTNIWKGLTSTTLSWLPGGRQLAFGVGRFTTGQNWSTQLRALDLTGSGTDLLTASRALFTVNVSNVNAATCVSLTVTPDGETAVCATQYNFVTGGGTNAGCANGGLEFTAYSVATGKPVRVLYQYRGACHNGLSELLWTDASASTIIGATEINVSNEGGKQADQVGVITDGHFRPLKITSSISPWNYPRLAF